VKLTSPPTSDKIKKTWIYTSTPPYVFMAESLVKQADNFIFYLYLHRRRRRRGRRRRRKIAISQEKRSLRVYRGL
jgi:hypothetical protein